MRTTFFHSIVRWNVERKGTTAPLPFFYYDASSLAAIYTASTHRVRRLIPHPDLHPIEFTPGRCLVAFAAFEYRKTDHEPYNEIGVSFLVSHGKRPIPLLTLLSHLHSGVVPSYVWTLPVSTEQARAGGADLYGYPKFLADIRISKDEDRVECALSVSGAEILRLVGRVLPTRPGGAIRYVTYAVDGDCLISVNTAVNRIEYAESRRRDSASLTIGKDHPISAQLRNIDLGEYPFIYQYSPRIEAILFPGRNIRDV